MGKKKSLDSSEIENVSNISVSSKVLEFAVVSQLQGFLEENYLEPFQLGFRLGYRTEAALGVIHRRNTSLLKFLDVSVAFDTLDHGILPKSLSGLSVGGMLQEWLQSFLTGRLNTVMLRDCHSTRWQLICTVPQGSRFSSKLTRNTV